MKLLAAITAAGIVAVTPVRVTITAPHTVKANAKWPVTIRVTNAAGKPLRATLTNRILLGSLLVGKVDNGKVWHIVGIWREPKGQEITWPASARGQTFNFETIVRASGRTVKKVFRVHVT
jgi:hypothetical protein